MKLKISQIKNHQILKKQTIVQATVLITVIIFLIKIIGYFREVLIAKYFGATGQTDAFLIAFAIHALIAGLISSGLPILIIPFYLEKEKTNKQRLKIFINQIFILLCLIGVVICSLIFLFTPIFVKLFAFGFEGQRFELAVNLTRWLTIFGFSTILTGLFTGIFYAKKQFLFPNIITLISNILVIFSLFLLAPYLKIKSLAIGYTFYAIFNFFALFIFLFKKWKFFQNFFIKQIHWAEIKRFLILLFPLILTGGIIVINQIVDKTIASSLETGSISVLNFAQKVIGIPTSLLIIPLVFAIYPTFSSLALEKKNKTNYVKLLNKALSLCLYTIIPVSFIFIILAQPIVKLLFQRGAFTGQDTIKTGLAVSMYSIGIFAYACNIFLIRVFYSFKNTKTPLIICTFIIAFNIIGSVVLSRILGTSGIALATSISAIMGSFLYVYIIQKKYFDQLNWQKFAKQTLKIIILSIPIGVLAIFLKPYLPISLDFFTLLLRLTLISALLTLVYLFFSFYYNIKELKIIVNYIKNYRK